MDTKIAGGVLLIVGTSIGGGMLALPVVTAGSGFVGSSLMLIAIWAVMTFCAFLILEVNLWFPPRNNMITMARSTLGKPGELVAWVSYILLLYALLTAYISGGTALFQEVFALFNIKLPPWINSTLFVLIFGYIVYRGIKPVDYVNRVLMVTKLGSLFILIMIAMPYLDRHYLLGGKPLLLTSTVTFMVTSFGFATIVPSLRSYFNNDVKKLRYAILIGSLIPLACYILWDFAILGSLPSKGGMGLIQMRENGGSATDISQALSHFLQNSSITGLAHLFTVICVLTAFLGVALCLVDFLADGLKIEKTAKSSWLIYALTFLPPLGMVLFEPTIFIKSFNYAGICAVILVVLLPALMAWSGRYRKNLATGSYQVRGGKWPVLSIILIAFIIIALGVKEVLH